MSGRRFYVLGPLMGGYGSKAFLGQELSPSGRLRPAVLIFLPEELIEDAELFERVRQETNVAVRLDHLNIITILGLVKLEDGYARVVEFADGESLRSVLARARELGREIPPPIAVAVLADACAGVHHAHQEGDPESGRPLLHPAVRPETILVTFRGIGMVTGYGTRSIMEKLQPARDESAGDPYSAPELASGGREAAKVQTDVFGLGVVLLEALTGKAPDELPETPAEGLETVACKAMSLEPGDRFDSALQLREALLQVVQPATKHEVSAFMRELFPDNLPQIKARKNMLRRGQLEYDADPPELSGSGPPESVDLVWRYPIREVSGPAPQPAPAKKPAKTAPAKKPPKPAPAKKQPEPAPAPKKPKPAPVAKKPEPAPVAKKPEPAPVTRRPAPPPPPPFPERKPRRKTSLVVLLVVLLVGGAFGLGLFFSDWGKKEPPPQPIVAAAATTTVQKPPAAPEPAPPKAKPPVKKAQTKKRRRKKRRSASRGRSLGTGYLNVKAPRGSKVYVRGRFIGTAPLRRYRLPSGRHKVVVKKKGSRTKYKRMVPISSGQEMTLTVQFY